MHRREIMMSLAGLAMFCIASVAHAGEPASSKGKTVTIDNFTFSPAVLTISAGTKGTWTNRDDIPHTVTDAARPPGFKSAALDTGDMFSWVFPGPGTYHYFCSLHPRMEGTVVVK